MTHSLSEENFRAAARSLRHAKRIDVPRVDYEKLASDRAGESTEAVRQRVLPAREKQLTRFDSSGLTSNADTPALAAHALYAALRRRRAGRAASVGPAHICEYCELDDTSKALMRSAMNQLGMSARAFPRVLKLARTIADLAGADHIQAAHPSAALRAGLAEAIHLRSTETARIGSWPQPAKGRKRRDIPQYISDTECNLNYLPVYSY